MDKLSVIFLITITFTFNLLNLHAAGMPDMLNTHDGMDINVEEQGMGILYSPRAKKNVILVLTQKDHSLFRDDKVAKFFRCPYKQVLEETENPNNKIEDCVQIGQTEGYPVKGWLEGRRFRLNMYWWGVTSVAAAAVSGGGYYMATSLWSSINLASILKGVKSVASKSGLTTIFGVTGSSSLLYSFSDYFNLNVWKVAGAIKMLDPLLFNDDTKHPTVVVGKKRIVEHIDDLVYALGWDKSKDIGKSNMSSDFFGMLKKANEAGLLDKIIKQANSENTEAVDEDDGL